MRLPVPGLLKIVLGCAFAVALGVATAAASQAREPGAAAVWEALKQPGSFAILRHALAPGTSDPAGFTLGDCSTQRNLDGVGRAQARAIGRAFAENGIVPDRVLTSQWCRSRETAELLAGELQGVPVEAFAPLNSFFQNRSAEPERTAATLARLRAAPPDEKLVLVSHFVNVRALAGVGTSSGEMVVARLDPSGAVEVLGTVEFPVRD